MPEEALEALGLGGVAATLLGRKKNSRSSSRDRDSRARSRSGRDRSRSKSHNREQLTQALKAAVLAGAATAFRARKEPGGWNGEKGKRVLTAAITAGGVDGLVNLHKDPEQHKFRDTVGSAIAGVATDRFVNGPRSRSRGRGSSPDGRGSRSRSRSRIRDLAAGGAIAAAAKKITDSVRGRSQSQSRRRSRSRSYDSYDSRSPPKRSRSRSIAGRALSAVGLDRQADKIDPAGARNRSRPRSRSRGGSRYADDDYSHGGSSMYDNRDVGTSNSRSRSIDPSTGAMIHRPRSVGPGGGLISPPPPDYELDYGPRHTGDPQTDSDSDLGGSSDDEMLRKKGRKRLLLSGGLATIATIHAGHSVYQSIEKRGARHRALKEGIISQEEAKKHKSRDRLQDAASIGLAALGIKGAYSEWKEVKESKEEHDQEREKNERHRWKRENRRRKASMVGQGIYGESGYSNSAPNLHNPFGREGLMSPPPGGNQSGSGAYYTGDGPYMSGAAQGQSSTHYYDDNPYGWMGQHTQDQVPQHHNPYIPGYAGNNGMANGNMTFPAPPTQGGMGFPPPPGGQPPPPTTAR